MARGLFVQREVPLPNCNLMVVLRRCSVDGAQGNVYQARRRHIRRSVLDGSTRPTVIQERIC